jgi:hypothetical protein
LKLVVTLMNEHPPSMIPAFDRKSGIRTVFKLLGSSSETIRLKTLKLLGFFLQKCTAKRKNEAMNVHNLFSLLTDRLLLHQNEFSMAIYNTLYEVCNLCFLYLLVTIKTFLFFIDFSRTNYYASN